MSGWRGVVVCLVAIVGMEGCGSGKSGSPASGGGGGGGGGARDASVASGGRTGTVETDAGSGGAGTGGAPSTDGSGGAEVSSGGASGHGTAGAGGDMTGGTGAVPGTGGAAPGSGGAVSSGGASASGGAPGSGGAVTASGGATVSSGGSGGGGDAGSAGVSGTGGAVAGAGGTATSAGGAGGGGGQAGAGGGGGASAPLVRPHILFIFDNSASMLADGGGTFRGEATNICPPTNPTAATRSKLYALKTALRGVLADIGTTANVGLMSFPILERTPPAYSTTEWCPTQLGGPSGHYAPAPAKPPRALGCDMTSHTSETAFGPWFGLGIGEVIRAGLTTAAPGTMPVASEYDPADANVPAVQRWIDNVELPMDPGPVTDPELHGMSSTPLGRSLFYARLYLDNFVKPSDPRAPCRQQVVVLLTDGEETCDSAAPDSTFDTVTCAGGGTTFSPFHPVYQACRLRQESGVKTYVITDYSLASSGLAANDRIATAGGTVSAVRVSLADSTQAKAAIQHAIASATPASCPPAP